MEARRPDLAELLVEVFEIEDTPELLDHLPELLADLPTLGGPLEDVVRLLREGGLVPGGRVLDLGCGRGEIALAVAREFEAEVVGVDGMRSFLDSARERAAAQGMAGQATFVGGDIRDYAAEQLFDAVLLISIGPIMGDYRATMEWLRGFVRPGGLIVIEDCYLTPEANPEAHPQYDRLEPNEALMTSFGDRIVNRLDDTEAMMYFNGRELMELVEARGGKLKQAKPKIAHLVDAYLARQRSEVEFLGSREVTGAIWLLERGPDG